MIILYIDNRTSLCTAYRAVSISMIFTGGNETYKLSYLVHSGSDAHPAQIVDSHKYPYLHLLV